MKYHPPAPASEGGVVIVPPPPESTAGEPQVMAPMNTPPKDIPALQVWPAGQSLFIEQSTLTPNPPPRPPAPPPGHALAEVSVWQVPAAAPASPPLRPMPPKALPQQYWPDAHGMLPLAAVQAGA